MPREQASVEQRVWSKVSFPRGGTDGCWIWTGTKHDHGYGQFHPTDGHRTTTHRWSLARKLGRPLIGFVLHSCDTPECINPAHLREGTQADNVYDAMSRNRMKKPPVSTRKGEQVPTSKLTRELVVEIRARAAAGEAHGSIARSVGVTKPTISMVRNRKTWKHIP